jgi:type I restriction enzyme R subunit
LKKLRERMFLEADVGCAVELIKLRQLSEFIAKEIAARYGLLPANNGSFDEALRALRLHAICVALTRPRKTQSS